MVPLLLILIPAGGGLVMAKVKMNEHFRNGLVLAVTGLTALLSLSLFFFVGGGESGLAFGLSLRLDYLGAILAVTASVIWFLATVYAGGYLAPSAKTRDYHSQSLITLGATLGTMLAGDLLTLLLFFEVMSYASTSLVTYGGEPQARHAGHILHVMSMIGGALILVGGILVYVMAGTIGFKSGGYLTASGGLSLVAFLCFLFGFGVKAGMFPVQIWLPEAHPVAPSPASALFSGIMLKVGALGLFRIFFNVYDFRFLQEMGWTTYLLLASLFNIILGSLFALRQHNLKRRLAYSSMAQMGYVLLGLALLSERALTGAIFQIFAHAIMKSCLFLTAGVMIEATGKTDCREYQGLGKSMPLTMGCFALASFSMIGIPPFNGFLSKWLLGLGALDLGRPLLVGVLLLSSLLNAAYYLPILIGAFFQSARSAAVKPREPGLRLLVPVVILALATVLFNLLPVNVLLNLSRITAKNLLGGGLGL